MYIPIWLLILLALVWCQTVWLNWRYRVLCQQLLTKLDTAERDRDFYMQRLGDLYRSYDDE